MLVSCSRLEEIPISEWFVVRLDIRSDSANLQKTYLNSTKLRTIKGGKHLRGDWSCPLNYWLSTTAEWSIKRLHRTISLAPIKLPQKQLMSYPRAQDALLLRHC